jgi:AcrR family transcriptional regulator
MSPRPAIDHIRKPQILRAAAEVITERGLAATRIADVAERAGTSPPAVIYWFESRDELLTAALTQDERAWAQSLESELSELPSAAAKLRRLVEASTADGDLSLWIELWARSLHHDDSAAERQRLDDDWRARIAAVIAEGQESGEFVLAADPAETALRLAALIDGFAVQLTLGDPGVHERSALGAVLEAAERMLGASLLDLEGQPQQRERAALAEGG